MKAEEERKLKIPDILHKLQINDYEWGDAAQVDVDYCLQCLNEYAEQYCEEKMILPRNLLKIARCPDCDGSGTIVSSVYPSGEIKDIEPCRWCWEKEQFLDQTNKQ